MRGCADKQADSSGSFLHSGEKSWGGGGIHHALRLNSLNEMFFLQLLTPFLQTHYYQYELNLPDNPQTHTSN